MYSAVILDGILPEQYLHHYILFVSALVILTSSRISPGDIETSAKLLDDFCGTFVDLYGMFPLSEHYAIPITISRYTWSS